VSTSTVSDEWPLKGAMSSKIIAINLDCAWGLPQPLYFYLLATRVRDGLRSIWFNFKGMHEWKDKNGCGGDAGGIMGWG
jgi:hypothetical protein